MLWMEKTTNNSTSLIIQNEYLQIMTLHILRQIGNSICKNDVYTSMADECTNASHMEQFTICIRWVDEHLIDREDVIGLRYVEAIDTDHLADAMKIVPLWLNLKLLDCHGQCYDGASNMVGSKRGVAAQLQSIEPCAVLTHCYAHALNLDVAGAIKQSKVCQNALD